MTHLGTQETRSSSLTARTDTLLSRFGAMAQLVPPLDGIGKTERLSSCDATGTSRLAFQQVPHLPEPTWPEGPRPQMLHLDTTVPTVADLHIQHERPLALGARLLLDRSEDEIEPLFVYADPAVHPFCIFVAPS
jgi:Glyoxalase-like domain